MKEAWLALAGVMVLLAVLAATPVPLETHVQFTRVASPLEIREAVTLLRTHYKSADDIFVLDPGSDVHRPIPSLEAYAREFLWVGRADVNNDGVDDRIYVIEERGWCGSAGCDTWIVDGRFGPSRIYCETGAHSHYFRILPRITVHGFSEMESAARIRWYGSKCFSGEPELEHELGDPDPIREPWWRRLF
ncbi:MAG: hypothetical protein FJX67_18510 [Alphaproteobacteria bacterium]|nr:hypothetical protein [Alphaproteobacteria bacterium]